VSGDPYPKEQQLRRGEKRYHRRVASPKRWQQIIDSKRGPCRICQSTGPVEFHHLVSRGIGGSDTESNIVPLCSHCHERVTANDRRFVTILRANLTDAEYAFAVETLGEARFEAKFSVDWKNG